MSAIPSGFKGRECGQMLECRPGFTELWCVPLAILCQVLLRFFEYKCQGCSKPVVGEFFHLGKAGQ
jgi:hypothetical protein